MPARLVIAPEAELDITEAYISPELAAQRDASGPGSSGFQYGRRHVLCRWYESRRAGLGEEFLSSVDACIERIRREPMIYSIVHEAYCRALIRRFPYAI